MKIFLKLLLLTVLMLPAWLTSGAQGTSTIQQPQYPVMLDAKSPAKDVAKPMADRQADVTASAATESLDAEQASAKRPSSPLRANGPQKMPTQEVGEFTVADGEDTDAHAPIWGYYCDNYYSSSTSYQTRTQMIYPASMLTDMAGKYIESLTFYTDANGINFSTDDGDVTLTVKIGVCTSATFSGATQSFSSSYSTVSQTVTPKKGDKTISVIFDDSFKYTANTNLLIEFRVTTAGTADANNGDTKFVGVRLGDEEYRSLYYYYYNGNSGTTGARSINLNFLPKVTFGIYEASGSYTVNKEYIDFGSVTCGQSVTQNVTIKNTTSQKASVSWDFAGLNANKFSSESTVTELAAGATLTFPITFTPGNLTGAMSGSLKMHVDNTLIQVNLRGKGVKDYAASVNPTSLDLGEVLVNGDGTATVTLTNTGQQTINPVATTEAPFSVASDGTGSLASGDTRKYSVTFAPTAEQDYTGILHIKDEAHDIDFDVKLSGKGVTTAVPYVVDQSQSGGTEPTVTVCEGTTGISQVPIWTNYMDWGCEGQMIYPNTLLGLNSDDEITSITFYTNSTSLSLSSGGPQYNPITVKVGKTSETTLSGLITTGLDAKYTGNIWSSFDNGKVTITFDTPYKYEGGNLVIDLSCPNNSSAYWGANTWKGVSSEGSSYYQYLNSSGQSVSSSGVINYLPMMTLSVNRAQQGTTEYARAEVVDWGSNSVNSFYSKTVTIYNPNNEAVTANLETTKPFYFDDSGSNTTKSGVTLPAGTSTQTLYFNPTEAAAYTSRLNITVDSHVGNTRLTGIGLGASGSIATRDSSFFAGITYDWIDSDGHTHTSNLAETATDPDQIIAMVKTVYTDKSIPGNYKRGYTSSGVNESGYPVTYPAVGTIIWNENGENTYLNNVNNYLYDDTYGWGIKPDLVNHPITVNTQSLTTSNSNLSTSATAYYAFMDSMEYKPDYEGVTLLLAEMTDDYNSNSVFYDPDNDGDGYWDNKVYDTDPAKNLRAYISNTVKSMRIVTDSKRTGSGQAAGTLFKLDVDKLNKFYLLAKGRLRWVSNSYEAETNRTYTGSDGNTHHYMLLNKFCGTPCYIYAYNSSYTTGVNGIDGYYDEYSRAPFRYMFEQFSPVVTGAASGLDDIYANLVNMESFGVVHDCANVADMNHQFMMYGDDSEAADCQDVRDLMFFVPDYRMLKDDDRDNTHYERFLYYNKAHQPTMGLFVIHQDEIPEGTKLANNTLYKHQLQWKSNLDDFLPSDDQYYELWELVVDEFGIETYVPVYERNADGSYVMVNGEKKPVILDRNTAVTVSSGDDKGKLQYLNVYVDMTPGSQTKTYVIRGRDKEGFLSLQMSNEQSIFIPGTDPAEMALLTSATYYSRYNPQTEHNCYSNKLQLKSNPNSIKASYLHNNSTLTINRSSSVQVDGQTVTTTLPVATAYVNTGEHKLWITVANQAAESDFPAGRSDAEGAPRAGYHANPLNAQNTWSVDYTESNGYVSFDFVVWDNFLADVSTNGHPGQYQYKLEFTTDESFEGLNGSTNTAYSNTYNVPVYKTDSRISEPRTLAEVLGDTEINPDYAPSDVEFQAQVQLSSKQNILRYDAYRWEQGEDRYIVDNVYGDDDEQDIAPTGVASNQGDWYTVSMNAIGTDDYYVGDNVNVNTTNTTNWAKFVDYYPMNEENAAGAYTYAPVVELFTRGYKVGSTTEKRDDYNTYGGPLQNTAVGKLEMKAYEPTSNDAGTANALMSDYWWEGDGTTGTEGEKYSYYNIQLDFNALDVPEGYELYKVRAWRKVDKAYLGEELATRRAVRIDGVDENGWYMFEDMNFGDALTDGGTATMKLENLFDGENTVQRLGARPATIAKPVNPDGTGGDSLFDVESATNPVTQQSIEEGVQGETRATFGARRLDLADEDNDFARLDAQFKVRAYFTRKSNPLIAGKSGYDPIYVVGNNGSEWDNSTALATLYTNDGTTYSGNITVPEVGNSGLGYFSFATSLPASGDNRFGAEADGNFNVNEEHYGQAQNLKYWSDDSRAFAIPAGTYYLSVNLIPRASSVDNNAGTVTITKGAVRAPRRDAAMTGSDYDYYVAEGECEFHQDGGSGVITGIGAVKMDVNREVVGVSYVNTIGQVSSTPWQGVNMVVTRYSDGSTTTQKVIR